MPDHRYIQPQSAKEALTLIQKLFNSYRKAPLTEELLAYHQQLLAQVTGDIRQAAIKEGPAVLADQEAVAAAMTRWSRQRLAGHPFTGKLRHFRLVEPQASHRFKRRVHKLKGGASHRASRH